MSEGTWIVVIAVVAFLVNLPLGRWRSRCRKLGPAWFTAVHASIPLIVVLRIWRGVPWAWAPFFVACAVAGQWLGGRRPTSRA